MTSTEEIQEILQSQNIDHYNQENALKEHQLESFERDKRDEFNKWLLDIEREILGLKMSFMGYIYDKNSKDYVKISKELINLDGANELVTFLIAHVNKATMSSNIKEKDLTMMMFDIEETLLLDLYYHVDEWSLSPSNIQKLKLMCVNFILFALKKSQEGFMIENINKMVRLSETTHRIDRGRVSGSQAMGQLLR